MDLSRLVPLGVRRRLRKGLGSSPSDKIFHSYGEAVAACGGEGYAEGRIAEVVVEKTKGFLQRGQSDQLIKGEIALTAIFSVVAAKLFSGVAADQPINVLDFGGGAGAHKFCVDAFVASRINWCVVETEQMVSQSQPLGSDTLTFVTDLKQGQAQLGDIHLLYSSGAIQYVPDPLDTLDRLLSLDARTVLISRLPLTDGSTFMIAQRSQLAHNGPGPLPPGFTDATVSYPATIVNREAFERVICSRYVISAHFRDSTGDLTTADAVTPAYGYFCTAR